VAHSQPSTIQWAPPGIPVQQSLPDGFHAARLTRSEFTHNPKSGNYTIKTEWTCENKARATIPLILFADPLGPAFVLLIPAAKSGFSAPMALSSQESFSSEMREILKHLIARFQ
jgi:hypothetical protein